MRGTVRVCHLHYDLYLHLILPGKSIIDKLNKEEIPILIVSRSNQIDPRLASYLLNMI